MILKKYQRKRLYQELLDIVCKDDSLNAGFCYFVSWDILQMPKYKKLNNIAKDYRQTEDFIVSELPELYSIRGTRTYDGYYWYPCTKKGWEIRINKLYNVIQSM